MPERTFHEGGFGFRYREDPDGSIIVWYSVEGLDEAAPVRLERQDADAFGALLEHMTAMLHRASPVSTHHYASEPSSATPHGQTDSAAEPSAAPQRAQTDPAELRRRVIQGPWGLG